MQLPVDFKILLEGQFGAAEASEMIEAIGSEPVVSIRLNLDKVKDSELPIVTATSSSVVPWCSTGYYLNKRSKFTFDPHFHGGLYYVQEASSMFLKYVLLNLDIIKQNLVALDLCAAPGGKSTLLKSSLSSESLLISNEIVPKRAQILAENMQKWGDANTIVTNNAPKDFSSFDKLFDLILADVPCSGEGMFRKDDRAVEEWSLNNVAICQKRQLEIIDSVWSTLKPGGILIYSTCTYNKYENESNIEEIASKYGATTIAVPLDPTWGIRESTFGDNLTAYRFLPHCIQGEGLFLAVLQKPGEYLENTFAPGTNIAKKKNKKAGGSVALPSLKQVMKECEEWILHSDNFALEQKGEFIYAFPELFMPILSLLQSKKLHILTAGVPLAQVKGKTIIPKHGLAISKELNRASFPAEELSYEQAIAYLRKEAIVLSTMAPKGYVLVTYKSFPLGFVKNLGNRSNNLYPSEWRIRSGYTTEQEY